MTIVIDVGCGRYGGDYSLERLINEFKPSIIYGFDPNVEGLEAARHTVDQLEDRATQVYLGSEIAWTHDGELGFVAVGLNSWVTDKAAEQVPCIDLARFITQVHEEAEGQAIVLKLDAEGSEYDLLPHLMVKGADELLTLAIIEWHERGIENAANRRRVIEKEIRCLIREWQY